MIPLSPGDYAETEHTRTLMNKGRILYVAVMGLLEGSRLPLGTQEVAVEMALDEVRDRRAEDRRESDELFSWAPGVDMRPSARHEATGMVSRD